MSPEVASALAQISHTENTLMMQMAALLVVPPQQPYLRETNSLVAADTVDRVTADTTDNDVVHKEDAEEVYAGVEDVDHSPRRHKMQYTSGRRSTCTTFWWRNRNAGTTKSCKTIQQLELLFLMRI
jgi:hypothetical protein